MGNLCGNCAGMGCPEHRPYCPDVAQICVLRMRRTRFFLSYLSIYLFKVNLHSCFVVIYLVCNFVKKRAAANNFLNHDIVMVS